MQLHAALPDVLLHDLRQVVDLEVLADRALDVDEHLHLDGCRWAAENETLLRNPLEEIVRVGCAVEGPGPGGATGSWKALQDAAAGPAAAAAATEDDREHDCNHHDQHDAASDRERARRRLT